MIRFRSYPQPTPQRTRVGAGIANRSALPSSRRPSTSGHSLRNPVRQQAFSLIELLVALAIFSTMAAISYAGLSAVTSTYTALDARERDLAALGRSLAVIERDLRGVARRPVRDVGGAPIVAMIAAADGLELSTHGRGRGDGQALGLIERIAYLRADGDLQRMRWPVLDRAAGTRPDRRPILADVDAVRWRFLGSDGRWQESWPPEGAGALADELPRAVEFVLDHARLGEVRRLVELPDSAP